MSKRWAHDFSGGGWQRRSRRGRCGTGRLLVQRIVTGAGHCSLPGAMREQVFDDLVAWIERGTVPEGDYVLADVAKLCGRWTR